MPETESAYKIKDELDGLKMDLMSLDINTT